MVGESVQEMQLAGWLPETTVALSIPGWVGLWFAVFPTVEGLTAQVLAAALVLGSYFGAEWWRVKRPRRQALARSARAEGPVHGPVLNPEAPRIGATAAAESRSLGGSARAQRASINAETTAS
jgi:high-affinity iron transporter